MNLICFHSNLLSNSQASKGSPQEQIRIPEISTPKIENMIDVGGRKLHCCVYGNGSPTVVLVNGGSVVRLFASMYPDDMGGLILEDTQHEDVLNELQNILKGKDLEAFDQLVVDRISAPGNPKTEADYRNITREQVMKSKPLPRMPFVILTSTDRAKAMQPIFSDEAIEKLDRVLNNKLAALIPGGRQIIVEGAGHNIHVDKHEALIAPDFDLALTPLPSIEVHQVPSFSSSFLTESDIQSGLKFHVIRHFLAFPSG